jgi:hypothetical protein
MTFAIALTDFLKQFIVGQPKQQQVQTSSQAPTVIKQPFPEYHKGTQELTFDLFTGEPKVPPIMIPSLSKAEIAPQKTASPKAISPKTILPKTKPVQAKSKAISTEKKPLTTETIGQTIGAQSSIPMWPYTPEGLLEALSQGKLNLAQAQQILKNLAPQDLSAGNIYDTIYKEIKNLPEQFQKELEKVEDKMDKAYEEVDKNLKKQLEINQKYADEQINIMKEHLNWVKNVFADLIKEKPNLEPDKWTEFGRRLAMALGAISAMAHPGYAPYFYMAIPQVVQYWQNEDMQNFEKALKKFELALSLAGTQLDFYNQIMEQNLAILEKQKEKDLLPLTLTGQLLMEKYHIYADTYNKMALDTYKVLGDSISNQLKFYDIELKEKHYKDWAEIQKLAKDIMLKRLEIDEWYKKQSLKIRDTLKRIAEAKFQLTKDVLVNPQKYIGKLLPSLISKSQDLTEALKLLQSLNFPVEGILPWLTQDEIF